MGTSSVGHGQLTVFDDGDALAEGVAHWLLQLALAKAGPFALCLSGGSTPKVLYQRLAQPPFRQDFPWDRTAVFFGDERFVPVGDKDSNFTMASQALLDHVPIPKAHVFRMVTEADSAALVAENYAATLKDFYGSGTLEPGRPLFDVNLLGLGPDGHTASLLPGQPVLDERDKWVAEVSQGRPEARITLTYPVLESARAIAFLVVGAGKADMLAHVRGGATDVPAGRLQTTAAVHWFADRGAVGDPSS